MFKKKEELGSKNLLKSSAQKGIRKKLKEQYPMLEPYWDQILPQKSPIQVAKIKCDHKVNVYICDNQILFLQLYDGPLLPHMKVLLQYPLMLKKMQCDKGAIKFILSGANVMCPGLTSKGGVIDESAEVEECVAITAEGKTNPLGIGILKMSASQIREKNEGYAIESVHTLGDSLYYMVP